MNYTTEELRIRLPCKTSGIFQSFFLRSFIRRSGVARRPPGIRHTPISDVLAGTTSVRYRDVVWKLFGHVDISDESDDGDRIGEVALPRNFGLRLRIIVPFRCSSLLISNFLWWIILGRWTAVNGLGTDLI